MQMSKNKCYSKVFCLIIACIMGVLLTSFFSNRNLNDNSNLYNIKNENFNEVNNLINKVNPSGTYNIIHTKEWLKDNNFNPPASKWKNVSSGDISDLNASLQGNEGRFEVLGDKRTFSFYSDLSQDWNWAAKKNPNFPAYPDTYVLNGSGACVSHYWHEGAGQMVAVNWERNLTLPVNMSDYIITSASIEAVVNASVYVPSENSYSDGIEAGNDLGTNTTQYATGDYVRFYVWVSDLDKNNVYEIAHNQTSNLGQDSPEIATMSDTYMTQITEESLIFYLTSALSNDYQNFTLSIGLRIWCEDNFATDSDLWELLIIKTVNLTFTYEKKIDQLTTLSWEQTGNQLNSLYTINNATLNFKYKLDDTWPSESPNSELRIIINGTLYSETIKLSEGTTSFQDAKSGGFDLTNLIQYDVNISISIQLFIADEFSLDKKITISIDNVSLLISYTEVKNEESTNYDLFLNGQNKTLSKTLEVPINEHINITFIYKNSTSGFISGANVILHGYDGSKSLDENIVHKFYNITIDTASLGLGESYFTIEASKFTFEKIEISITINVVKRDSFIDNIILNNTKTTSIEIFWNEPINISASYNDTLTNNSIPNAKMYLSSGWTKNFTYNPIGIYTLTFNTKELKLGTNFLTISANDMNHSLTTEIITIIVNPRSSHFKSIKLNDTETDIKTYSNGENINITVKYFDFANDSFIDDAHVYIKKGTTWQKNLTENKIFDQYEIILNSTSDLGGEPSVILTITAQKENYTMISTSITIFITERGSNYSLIIDSIDVTKNPTIKRNVNESVSIIFYYRDKITKNPLLNATIKIKINETWYNFDNQTGYYNFTFNTLILPSAYNTLVILAEKVGYTSQQIIIEVEIVERSTKIDLFINGEKKTEEPYIKIVYGKILNISVNYTDAVTNKPFENSTVELLGDYIATLTFNLNTKLYTLEIDTKNLILGLNFITVLASRENYESQRVLLQVEVSRIRGEIYPKDGESTIEARPNEDITIIIELHNLDFGGKIGDAIVSFTSNIIAEELREGIFKEVETGVYKVILKNVPEGTYTIIISVTFEDEEKLRIYNIEQFEITLIVEKSREEVLLFQVISILAIVATLAVTGYLIAYQKVLKYPKSIRKVRGYRKGLKKKELRKKLEVGDRDSLFTVAYLKTLGNIGKTIKSESDKIKGKQGKIKNFKELLTEEKAKNKNNVQE